MMELAEVLTVLTAESRRDKNGRKRVVKEALSPIFPFATAPFPKARASYFRCARFNTSPLYYLRACTGYCTDHLETRL